MCGVGPAMKGEMWFLACCIYDYFILYRVCFISVKLFMGLATT